VSAQKIWVISDTHFGHALMATTRGFGGDIEAHDKALFDAWSATVAPHEGQLRRFRLNIHGHTHAARLPDARYVPVSVEHLPGWRPILLQAAIESGTPT
jgi:calcineurin-like phosphoesterase family protein